MKHLIRIKVTGEVDTVEVPEDNVPLETLQNLVGEYIETLRLSDESAMIIDHYGKLKDKDLNFIATTVSGIKNDYIAGNAVLALIDGENLVGYDADRAQRLSEQLGRMLVSGR